MNFNPDTIWRIIISPSKAMNKLLQKKLLIESLNKVFNNFLADAEFRKIKSEGIFNKELKETVELVNRCLPKCVKSGCLLDLAWYDDNEKGQLIELVMVLESEWAKSFAGIKYDFEKLLICKCPLKVMVCQWTKADIQNLFDKIESSINAFGSSTDETYLLVVLDSSTDKEFIFKTFGSSN